MQRKVQQHRVWQAQQQRGEVTLCLQDAAAEWAQLDPDMKELWVQRHRVCVQDRRLRAAEAPPPGDRAAGAEHPPLANSHWGNGADNFIVHPLLVQKALQPPQRFSVRTQHQHSPTCNGLVFWCVPWPPHLGLKLSWQRPLVLAFRIAVIIHYQSPHTLSSQATKERGDLGLHGIRLDQVEAPDHDGR